MLCEQQMDHTDQYAYATEQTMQAKHHYVGELNENLLAEDNKHGADVLRPTFDATRGGDGYVSIEVSPYLAMDTQRTIVEAKRLWREVDRKNLMIKVPATQDGLPAIRELTAEGINVNITLLFSQQV